MPLYNPPTSFVQRLRAYDPLLRLRWSDRESCWLLERQITRARSIDPERFKERDYETFVARREGYLPILKCEREQLDNRLLISLWHMDIQRRGGANRVADEMESGEAMRRAAHRAKFLDEVWVAARERQEYMNVVRTLPSNAIHRAPKGGLSIVAGSVT